MAAWTGHYLPSYLLRFCPTNLWLGCHTQSSETKLFRHMVNAIPSQKTLPRLANAMTYIYVNIFRSNLQRVFWRLPHNVKIQMQRSHQTEKISPQQSSMLILVTTAEKNKYILQSSGVRGNEYAQLSHFSAEQYYTVVHVGKKFGSEILSGRATKLGSS